MVEFQLERTPLQKFCADVWWLVLLQGAAAAALGGLLLARPRATILIVVTFLGVFFLVDGVIILMKSLRGRRRLGVGWWGVVIGTLCITAGIVVLAHPLASAILTATVLVTMLALAALSWGLLSLFAGIRLLREVQGEWSLISGGLLSLGIGALLLARPVFSAKLLVGLIAVFSLLSGIVFLVLAIGIIWVVVTVQRETRRREAAAAVRQSMVEARALRDRYQAAGNLEVSQWGEVLAVAQRAVRPLDHAHPVRSEQLQPGDAAGGADRVDPGIA